MKANLHANRKNISILMAIVIAVSVLLSVITSMSTVDDIRQLNALYQSEYEYSAVTQEATVPDQYIQFNAGIWFALSSDAEKSLNVDVVMQTESSVYTDSVSWNTEKLGDRGVAISKNIADSYDLSVGDMLFSKHVVDGTVYAYRIEAIIPTVKSARTSESSYSAGLVVMGYDYLYTDNITHKSLIFTQKPIAELTELCSSTPEQLIYREDEMLLVATRILPYVLVYMLVSVCCAIGLVYFLSRQIEHNFRRLAMIGYAQHALNSAYNALVWSYGSTAIAATLLVGAAGFGFKDFSWMYTMPAAIAAITEIIAVWLTSSIIRRRLWRK